MNFALSQRRTDRHPVGLVIVVGLHVLLAAGLLSARLVKTSTETPPIALTPLDPVQPVPKQPIDLPKVVPTLPRQLVIPTVHDQPARITPRRAVLDAGAAQCRPTYPAAAQRAGATGVSRIRFTVDALGRIAGAQILQSSGPTREHHLMDRAAADALAQCPVKPGTDELGRPTGGTADVDYVWSLD